jgi:hypothetical protein
MQVLRLPFPFDKLRVKVAQEDRQEQSYCNRRSFDSPSPSTSSGSGSLRMTGSLVKYVVSHPSRKYKNAARVGHPALCT